jgi:hypothetical protein
VQHLKSVNCHDSRAHGHEQHGPFTQLVGVYLGWFGLGFSWSSWYVAGAMPVSSVGFGYR